MGSFFKLDRLVMQFGGLTAVSHFSMELQPGELVGLIGPNGAGKTTVFNMIAGFLIPTSGRVIWQGEDVTPLPAQAHHRPWHRSHFSKHPPVRRHDRAGKRDGFLPSQDSRPFLAGHVRSARPIGAKRQRIRGQKPWTSLQELGLAHLAEEKAGSLPYGQQRRLEIARALATRPRLLLLDEPAAGMNPQETLELAELVRESAEQIRPDDLSHRA